jgi:hypothetical protein
VLQCWDIGLLDGSTFIEFARPCDSFRWDPGSSEGSKFPRFGVKFGFGDGLNWDPGALEGLADMSRFIELTRLSSDFHTAQLDWFPMVLWPQQKCGGTDRIAPYNAPLIQFSSWMGGDCDGNSRVTPEVPRNVCLLARVMVANLYNSQIEDLMFELAIGFSEVPDEATFTDVEQFLEPLELCYRPLCACGDHPVADRAGTTPSGLVPLLMRP